jgi:hypothetical protein
MAYQGLDRQGSKGDGAATAAWEKYGGADENPEAEEELNIALDDLAVAHSAAAFEGWSGKLKW